MGKGRNWDLAMNKFDVDIKRIPYQGETLTLLTFHLVLDNFYIHIKRCKRVVQEKEREVAEERRKKNGVLCRFVPLLEEGPTFTPQSRWVRT